MLPRLMGEGGEGGGGDSSYYVHAASIWGMKHLQLKLPSHIGLYKINGEQL